MQKPESDSLSKGCVFAAFHPETMFWRMSPALRLCCCHQRHPLSNWTLFSRPALAWE